MKSLLVTLVCLLAITHALPAVAHDIVRRVAPDFPIARSVIVPAGTDLVFLSGTLADAADPSAPAGSPERFGDTAAQALSVLGKIEAELAASDLSMSDIVKMNVYLVGDPAKGGAMDFAGLMSAYVKYFGREAALPPARTTLQVAGLPIPGALVEIEVVAARNTGHEH